MIMRSTNTPEGLKEWRVKLINKRARVLEKLSNEAAALDEAKQGAILSRRQMMEDLRKEVSELELV